MDESKDFLDALSEETPTEEGDNLTDSELSEQEPERIPFIVAYRIDNGFEIQIDSNANYITVAGIAWYLQQQAEIGLNNAMFLKAQEEERKQRLALPRQMRRHPNN